MTKNIKNVDIRFIGLAEAHAGVLVAAVDAVRSEAAGAGPTQEPAGVAACKEGWSRGAGRPRPVPAAVAARTAPADGASQSVCDQFLI
jgi:hypothetical protein